MDALELVRNWVDTFCRDARNLAWLREQIRNWSQLADDERTAPGELAAYPRGLTERESLVLAAAVYDQGRPATKIDPWTHDQPDDGGLPYLVLGVAVEERLTKRRAKVLAQHLTELSLPISRGDNAPSERIRRWLAAEYMDDPAPDDLSIPEGAPKEPIVFVRYSKVKRFLQGLGEDPVSTLEQCKRVGWTHDTAIGPRDSARPKVRLVAIRKTVCAGPVEVAGNGKRNEGDSVNAGRKPRKKPRGRRKADYDTVVREAKLAAEWERYRDTGGYKGTFVRDLKRRRGYEKMDITPFNRLLNRVAKRRKAAESDSE